MACIRSFLALLLPLLLAGGISFPAAAQIAWPHAAAQEDGPYVLWQGQQARVLRVKDGKLQEETRKAPFQLDLPGAAAHPLHLDGRPPAAPRAEFPQPEKILAVSDIHGAFDALVALLKAHGVVDGTLAWRFGKGHVVVVGDLHDRGAKVTELVWFLRALEPQAERAGGRVHVLLGNHEAMLLQGDLRYLNAKYQNLLKGTLPPMAELLGQDSETGRWLRSRPAMVKLGRILFVHGGLSPALVSRRPSIAVLNAEFLGVMGGGADPGAAKFLLGDEGPLWFRGLIPGIRPTQEQSTAQVQEALAAFGARAVVVGHSTLDRVSAFHGGRVFGVDAGLKDGKAGEVWIWEKGQVWRGTVDGKREAL